MTLQEARCLLSRTAPAAQLKAGQFRIIDVGVVWQAAPRARRAVGSPPPSPCVVADAPSNTQSLSLVQRRFPSGLRIPPSVALRRRYYVWDSGCVQAQGRMGWWCSGRTKRFRSLPWDRRGLAEGGSGRWRWRGEGGLRFEPVPATLPHCPLSKQQPEPKNKRKPGLGSFTRVVCAPRCTWPIDKA